MSEVNTSSPELNPQAQSTLDKLEESLKGAVNSMHAVYTAPTRTPLTTDPLQPEHHSELIDHAENVLSYVSVEVQKHQDLVNIIETFKKQIDSHHNALLSSKKTLADLINPEVKKEVQKEVTLFNQLTLIQKIEIVGGAIALLLVLLGCSYLIFAK